MSTKTLRKRIALVAVSAMGFGLLTSVSAQAAGTDGAIVNLTGSTGLLASSSVTGLSGTATLMSTGTLSVTLDAAAAGAQSRLEVVGGAVKTTASGTVSNDQTKATEEDTGDYETNFAVTITPTVAAGGKMYISTYATAAGTTKISYLTVTVASSSVAGTVSVADSSVAFTAADGDAATTDVVGASAAAARTPLYLNVQLNDAYSADITSTSGALVVETSAGSVAKISADAGAVGADGTTNLAVSTVSPADINIRVAEKTAGAGWSGTIKVSYNGVVIATKSGTIAGDPAKITITPVKIGKNNGAATAGALEYQVYDAAGNAVVLAFASLVFSSSSNEGIVSAAAGSVVNTTTSAGKATVTCVDGASGSSDVVLKTTLSDGTVIKSNSAKVNCAGDAASYTAAFDKPSYKQGEIAKLTVTFKDSKGNLANGSTAVTADPNDAALTAPQLDRVTGYTAAQKLDVNGQVAFTFTVGTSSGLTAGDYNAIVSFPTINAVDGANQTVKYSVATASTGVSNAEVLAAIVKLIASINKQIAALQKALLKK